ncbi:hypothetical protein FBULB1_8423 [Fusarium bulbicola]|nr:hypothetical protein FBULB1_8423 [Fusarium bulbicola]
MIKTEETMQTSSSSRLRTFYLNNGATHKCCNDYHGVYSGNDCKASSISEHLSGFDRCCKGQGSDCDFPGRAAALGQEMRAVKHVEIKTALANAQIASYVSGAVSSVFGAKQSMRIGNAASRQVSRQFSSHSIEGTLVLSVSCPHKNSSTVAPFLLHVDKAIKVWNHVFPRSKLDPTNGSSMMNCAMNESQEDKEKFSIIQASLMDLASLQREELLSRQNIQSHVTVLSMGVIPSVVAHDVTTAASKFNEFDPSSNMANVATMQNAISSDQYSVQSMAEASRTTGQASEIIPINYYLKDIDQEMPAQMWASSYYPGEFMAIKYDNTEGGGPAEEDLKAKL